MEKTPFRNHCKFCYIAHIYVAYSNYPYLGTKSNETNDKWRFQGYLLFCRKGTFSGASSATEGT